MATLLLTLTRCNNLRKQTVSVCSCCLCKPPVSRTSPPRLFVVAVSYSTGCTFVDVVVSATVTSNAVFAVMIFCTISARLSFDRDTVSPYTAAASSLAHSSTRITSARASPYCSCAQSRRRRTYRGGPHCAAQCHHQHSRPGDAMASSNGASARLWRTLYYRQILNHSEHSPPLKQTHCLTWRGSLGKRSLSSWVAYRIRQSRNHCPEKMARKRVLHVPQVNQARMQARLSSSGRAPAVCARPTSCRRSIGSATNRRERALLKPFVLSHVELLQYSRLTPYNHDPWRGDNSPDEHLPYIGTYTTTGVIFLFLHLGDSILSCRLYSTAQYSRCTCRRDTG